MCERERERKGRVAERVDATLNVAEGRTVCCGAVYLCSLFITIACVEKRMPCELVRSLVAHVVTSAF